MDINYIFVVGAGTMGNGIAQTAATSGYHVTMMDVAPEQLERGKAAISKSVEKLLNKGAISQSQVDAALNIKSVATMETVAEADLVIEAASENPDLKLKIFRDLDRQARCTVAKSGRCPARGGAV